MLSQFRSTVYLLEAFCRTTVCTLKRSTLSFQHFDFMHKITFQRNFFDISKFIVKIISCLALLVLHKSECTDSTAHLQAGSTDSVTEQFLKPEKCRRTWCHKDDDFRDRNVIKYKNDNAIIISCYSTNSWSFVKTIAQCLGVVRSNEPQLLTNSWSLRQKGHERRQCWSHLGQTWWHSQRYHTFKALKVSLKLLGVEVFDSDQ